jgi:hypothetical protein
VHYETLSAEPRMLLISLSSCKDISNFVVIYILLKLNNSLETTEIPKWMDVEDSGPINLCSKTLYCLYLIGVRARESALTADALLTHDPHSQL